jgi:hypothetical protein
MVTHKGFPSSAAPAVAARSRFVTPPLEAAHHSTGDALRETTGTARFDAGSFTAGIHDRVAALPRSLGEQFFNGI